MDVDKALQTYQIEYMVLKEEMCEQGTESEPQSSQGKQLEGENKELQKQNTELSDQLQVKCLMFFLIIDKFVNVSIGWFLLACNKSQMKIRIININICSMYINSQVLISFS